MLSRTLVVFLALVGCRFFGICSQLVMLSFSLPQQPPVAENQKGLEKVEVTAIDSFFSCIIVKLVHGTEKDLKITIALRTSCGGSVTMALHG